MIVLVMKRRKKMPNPNKNKHFNDEALRINRMLKKENDKLKQLLKARETIRIPITENDFEHELKNLVFNGEEFEWGAFYTVETERAIDVEFIGDQNE
tara:strand:+ start:22 stop:312 length:291 start_codon:yes stop_codon:yes gene_type:complete